MSVEEYRNGIEEYRNKLRLRLEEMVDEFVKRQRKHKLPKDKNDPKYIYELIGWWICQSAIDTINDIIHGGAGKWEEGMIYENLNSKC